MVPLCRALPSTVESPWMVGTLTGIEVLTTCLPGCKDPNISCPVLFLACTEFLTVRQLPCRITLCWATPAPCRCNQQEEMLAGAICHLTWGKEYPDCPVWSWCQRWTLSPRESWSRSAWLGLYLMHRECWMASWIDPVQPQTFPSRIGVWFLLLSHTSSA